MKIILKILISLSLTVPIHVFAGATGDLVCGPVAIRREDASEIQRLEKTFLITSIDDNVNEFAIQKEFSAADFKDAKFDGKLFLRAKGQRLDETYPEGLKGKFILTISFYHYTLSDRGDKIGHASGYVQGSVFEPLTGNADGDDKVLKGAGGTCIFLPAGSNHRLY